MSRKELYAKVKELNLQEEIKKKYGDNYTRVGNTELEAIIAKHTEKNTTPIYIDVIADHFTRDDMQDDSRKDYLP